MDKAVDLRSFDNFVLKYPLHLVTEGTEIVHENSESFSGTIRQSAIFKRKFQKKIYQAKVNRIQAFLCFSMTQCN